MASLILSPCTTIALAYSAACSHVRSSFSSNKSTLVGTSLGIMLTYLEIAPAVGG
jgi:hypothetical protein